MCRTLLLVALVGGCTSAPDVPTGLHIRDSSAITLLDLPLAAWQIGVVPSRDDALSYDPAYLDNISVGWLSPIGAEALDGGFRLLYPQDVSATVMVQGADSSHQTVRWTPDDPAAPIGFFRLNAQASATEGFYGLGEVFDTPNHRGKVRDLQLEVDAATESFNNEAHVPVPLLIGTTGWGLFVADDHPMRFEVATVADDLVRVTVGVGMDGADGLELHLYQDRAPLSITHRYYQTTGDALLPAPWGLGPWVWRDENDDQAQVLADLHTIRALDLPTSGYWIDRPYASGVNTFDFDPTQFPDPQAMINEAHALGFRMALWHTPYADPIDAQAVYDEGAAGGFFPPEHPPVFNNWSEPVDLTNPDAFEWWQGWIQRYTDMGIEGFKLDYAEDVVVGLNGNRFAWSFWDGSDERTMHKGYARLYHQVYAETLPATGGFLLCRTGTWGDQVHTSVIWPGDLDATLAAPGEPGSDYVSVGGLPAAVVAGQSLGVSGFPFFGSDTGGYRHAPPSKETFMRWFEHTALSTVMQVGTNSNDVAWEFTPRNGFDEESLAAYRDYTRLHLRLFPYLWTYAQRIAVTGEPIVRPLGLAHPELGVHPPYDYLVGEDLLAAPVVREGERTRDVVLPAGRWIHWFTGEVYEAGEHTVSAPLDELPLFLREGGVLPMLRPGVDTLAPATRSDEVDSFESDAGPLFARVFAGGAERSFQLYDGATIAQVGSDSGFVFTWTPGEVFTDRVVFEVVGMSGPPASAATDGVPLSEVADPSAEDGWRWRDGRLEVSRSGQGVVVVVL